MGIVAHIDEAGAKLSPTNRLYVVAAVLTSPENHELIAETLRSLQITRAPLHFHEESHRRRISIAQSMAQLPLQGAIVLVTSTTNSKQERARKRLLNRLLPRLEHDEGVQQAVLESRGRGDSHDQKTRDHLRKSHTITKQLRIEHAGKENSLLWPADFVASSYIAAHHHDEREPWDILSETHPIDPITIDPR